MRSFKSTYTNTITVLGIGVGIAAIGCGGDTSETGNSAPATAASTTGTSVGGAGSAQSTTQTSSQSSTTATASATVGTGGATGSGGAGGAPGTGGATTSAGGAATSSGGAPASGTGGATSSTTATGSGGACTTTGQSCALGGTGNGIVGGTCACGACPSTDSIGDAACATAYGAGSLCLAGTSGNLCLAASGATLCRSTSGTPGPGCPNGETCNTATNTCGPCTQNSDCGAGSVCSGGACVVGNCVSSSDCASVKAGDICGIITANVCGACTSDAECAGDPTYAAGNEGFCISGACSAAPTTNACTAGTAGAPGTCNNSTNGDICCAGACLANTGVVDDAGGNPVTRCCGTGKQNCATGQTCVSNYCSACTQVPTTGTGANIFYVDPTGGNDNGTGINNAGCQFKTMARALAAVGVPTGATTIVLLGDIPATSGTFTVSSNISISGGTAAAVAAPNNTAFTPSNRTLHIAQFAGVAAQDGFIMLKDSALSFLTIDGAVNGTRVVQGGNGVLVQGNGRTGISLDHVIVQNMLNTGIAVGDSTTTGNATTNVGGGVTLGAGVVSQNNGTATVLADGLLVTGTGTATIDPTLKTSAIGGVSNNIAFNGNSNHGIAVLTLGSITLQGDSTKQNVVANANVFAGLTINQTAGGAAPANTVTGLVATGSTTGNGILLTAGSKVVMRTTIALGNKANGVFVQSYNGLGTAVANDLTGLDLGHNGQVGGNTFQAITAATPAPNGNAGICLNLAAKATSSLQAEGNTLVSTAGAAVTCEAVVGVTFRGNGCAPLATAIHPLSVGIEGTAGNAIDVTACTTP